MKTHLTAAFIALLLPVLCGCGGETLMEIRGTVTVGEEPLVKGRIDFVPADGQGPTAAAVIKNGKYSVKITPGEKRVQILGFRKLREERPWGPDSPVMVVDDQILPPQYNEKTKLTCDVRRGTDVYDFTVEAP